VSEREKINVENGWLFLGGPSTVHESPPGRAAWDGGAGLGWASPHSAGANLTPAGQRGEQGTLPTCLSPRPPIHRIESAPDPRKRYMRYLLHTCDIPTQFSLDSHDLKSNRARLYPTTRPGGSWHRSSRLVVSSPRAHRTKLFPSGSAWTMTSKRIRHCAFACSVRRTDAGSLLSAAGPPDCKAPTNGGGSKNSTIKATTSR
jgi:hypothetical protein